MNRIGLSLAVSLGEAMNVDFGEVLDYLANDERTRYILLHVEKIRHARRFISALRSAARIKPVILLKSGNHVGDEMADPDAAELADQVFDAAVRRAGVVRVRDLGQLFHAARALASGFHPARQPAGHSQQRHRPGAHGGRQRPPPGHSATGAGPGHGYDAQAAAAARMEGPQPDRPGR